MVVNDFIDLHIEDHHDLSVEHIAHVLNIKIGVNEDMNYYIKYEGGGCTHRMFNDYQEDQADKFTLLLMTPEKIIMRHKLYDARKISCHFNVPVDLAPIRINMLIDRTRVTTYTRQTMLKDNKKKVIKKSSHYH